MTRAWASSSGFAYRGTDETPAGVTVELLLDFARFAASEHGLDVDVEWVEEERGAGEPGRRRRHH